VFTGTTASGLASADTNCANWTSTTGDAEAGTPDGPWNAGRTVSCAATAPAPRLYCFAVR
jgi:hypothetical protein